MGRQVARAARVYWHKLHITACQSSDTICNLRDINQLRSADGRAHAATFVACSKAARKGKRC